MPNAKREKIEIGQLLIVGFEEAELTPPLNSLLKKIEPSGVILFARNIVSPQQTYQLLRDCRKTSSTPMFTCVDMEGGRVDRFRKAISPSPSAAAVFATGDRKLYRKHGAIIGNMCRALGFNTDFAPVLDLALEASRTVMSSRAVSADPKQVVIYAREFLAGLKSSGVLGCGKHFPGLGEADLDSHQDLPKVSKSFQRLWNEDIYPYRALGRNLPMALIGHAAYPQVTKNNKPASLSHEWITDILRKKIDYRGLIVSDDMEMGGVLVAAPIEEAAIQFIRAGGDLCLICRQREFVERAYEALIKEVERDRHFARRVKESVTKVSVFKKKSSLLQKKLPAPTAAGTEKLSRQLWEFEEQVRLKTIALEAAR